MPRKSPFKISLSQNELQELSDRARKYTLPYYMVQRAKAILLAAAGVENKEIAQRLATRREVIWLWRKRFYEKRLAGLDNLPRLGRTRR